MGDVTQQARVDDFLFRLNQVRCASPLRADLNASLELSCCLDHQLALVRIVRGRLLDINVLACQAPMDREQRVPVVGRGDHEHVHGFIV